MTLDKPDIITNYLSNLIERLGDKVNELKDFLETENLLFLAEALFSAAEERSESIGAFCREDQLYAGATPYHTATEWRKGRFLTERRPL